MQSIQELDLWNGIVLTALTAKIGDDDKLSYWIKFTFYFNIVHNTLISKDHQIFNMEKLPARICLIILMIFLMGVKKRKVLIFK